MAEIEESTKRDPSFLNSQELEVREYQTAIANECAKKNSLVVLPTGLGKTIIAVLVAIKILKTFPPNSKILVLAPTRPLIDQHRFTFMKFLKLPEDKFAILTGRIPPENRVDVFNTSQIMFFTPQTLRNDLVNRKYNLKDVALIIFDECHHATGDYPYTMISNEFVEDNPDGITLALTASPGASKNKITTLCENLHIPLKNIHIRTRKDVSVKKYLKPMDIFKIGVKLTSLMKDMYDLLIIVLEERLHYLSQLNFLDAKGEILHTKVIRKDLLRLNKELVDIVKGDGDKTGAYRALSINAQGLIVYHMLELIEQQGLDILLIYLKKLNKDAKKRNSSKANRILAADNRIRKIYIELSKHNDFSPEELIHPKFNVMSQVIVNELRNNSSSRILVFVKLRNSVKNIVTRLKENTLIKPARFVGQATKSQDDRGLSQKRQIEILDQFKKGIFNVLVSTNVAEEGLDIAECNLVIFFDVVASEIRLIQRKGRTARKKEGKVVILYCKETHDEIYLKIALSKLKRMNIALKNPQQLKDSYSQTTLEPSVEVDTNYLPEKVDSKISKPKLKREYQSKLHTFVDKSPENEPTTEEIENTPIKISRLLSTKFGLRKKFQESNISFKIIDSDLHIVIHNKVLIQIFNPRDISSETIVSQIEELKEICSLLIIIFDFIDFVDNREGEKRVLKRKIQELGEEHNFHIIAIDNEEELFFILKNIFENSKKVV